MSLLLVGCQSAGPVVSPGSPSSSSSSSPPSPAGARPDSPAPPGRLSVGSGHACFFLSGRGDPPGELWCWGSNQLGSIGRRAPPPGALHRRPIRVDLTADELTALPEGARLDRAQVGPLVDGLALGVRTCGRSVRLGWQCWGGEGLARVQQPRPVTRLGAVDEWAAPPPVRGLEQARPLEGEGAVCLVHQGQAWCAGKNDNGRLTPGDVEAADAVFGGETALHPLALPPVSDVAIGGRHGCALEVSGEVVCWGLNNFGQLGNLEVLRAGKEGSAAPVRARGLTEIVELASGSFHTCARSQRGEVWCWGRNDEGQVGRPFPPDVPPGVRSIPVPVQLAGLPRAVRLEASGSVTCALGADGGVWCWGENRDGQLGDGTAESRDHPVRVKLPEPALDFGVGESTNCARGKSGQIYCSGSNEWGLLGPASVEDSALPVAVELAVAGGARSAPEPEGAVHLFASPACGLEVSFPGRREVTPGDGSARDHLLVVGAGGWRLDARCLAMRHATEQSLDELAARLRAEPPWPGAAATSQSVGDASCLSLQRAADEGHRASRVLHCLHGGQWVHIVASAPEDAELAHALESLSFSEPTPGTAPLVLVPVEGPERMLGVPGGLSLMGCAPVPLFEKPGGDMGCSDDSTPLHRVRVRAFALDVAEVTRADFKACVQAGACTAKHLERWDHLDHDLEEPMTKVGWDEAAAYCAFKGKRLPTEAEWERAARAHRADPQAFPFVGLGGGVKEWTADIYARGYYFVSPVDDPQGPASGVHRSIRDATGPFAADPLVHTFRQGRAAGHAHDDTGLRCARSLPEP